MEVKELQKKITRSMKEWDKVKGKKYSKTAAFAHLVEEVGELAQEFVHEERSPSKYDEEKLKDALGDILIYIVLLASFFKVDIEELIVEILRQDRRRRASQGGGS